MKKKLLTAVTLLQCATIVMAAGACGAPEGQRGKVSLTFWAVVNENNNQVMTQIVNNFNQTNERYTVRLIPKTSGYSASLGGTLKGSTPPNIVQIDDRYYKNYVNQGYLTNLDEYFADKKDENGEVVRAASTLDLNDFWSTAAGRCRYNPETGYSGGDNPLYSLPGGISPGVMYYNATALKGAGINVISVAEGEVASYNGANGTEYLARGYYVYDSAPAEGLTAKDGKYHVFNNQIPMSFEELVEISTLFTKSYNAGSPTNYGFFNEWWFSFGWSVGGDCLEWDEEKGQYVMALGEETANYLVTGKDGLTVNGTAYAEGDILTYTDKHYVADVLASSSHADYTQVKGYVDGQFLYELPSIRDTFELFLRLPQSKTKNVTEENKGLALSPTPTIIGNKSKTDLLTSKECAFVVEDATATYSLGKAMAGQNLEWDVSPLYQYREYDESGALKKVNGTEVKGKLSTHSVTLSYAIPANAKAKDGAFQFIEYLAGPEAQALMMKANFYLPNQKSLAYSDEYRNATENYMAKNKSALLMLTENSSVGDWSYLETGEWVNVWAKYLNKEVRNGEWTLEQFFSHECIAETNEALKSYKAKKFNG